MSKKIFGTLALAIALMPLAAAPSQAKDGDIRKSGTCSDGAVWKLKAGKRDGGLEVEAEVDSNINGQTWGWKLKRDGVRFAKGTNTTHAPSGSFSVERRTGNGAGTETITFRAVRGDAVCKGSLRI